MDLEGVTFDSHARSPARDPDLSRRCAHGTGPGLQGRREPDILSVAANDGRILITHDRRTMPIHFGTFIQTKISPGVFIIQQETEIVRIIEDLILIWAASEAEEYVNSIRTVPL